MVGNGVADSKFDGNALVPFANGMGLISDGIFEVVEKRMLPRKKERDMKSYSRNKNHFYFQPFLI